MEKSFFPEIICSRGFIKQVGDPITQTLRGWGGGGWLAVSKIIGNFSNDDGDSNENGKRNRFRLTKLCTYVTLFVYYNVKLPNLIFFEGRKHKTTIFFF